MRALLFALVFAPVAAFGQDKPPQVNADYAPLLAKAQRAIDAGAAKEALAVLDAADQAATTDQERARVLFYRARAYEASSDVPSAATAYEGAISANPNYGAALNNLAHLRAREGDIKQAVVLLDRAVSLNDARQLQYKKNLASIAADAGEVAMARELFEQILKAEPDDIAAESRLVRIVEPGLAVHRLRAMLNRGAIVDAQSLAIERLSSPDGSESDRRALLGIVVASLVRQHIPLDAFGGSPVAASLAVYRQHPDLGEGVREIQLVYDRAPAAGSDFAWWRRGRESQQSFAALLREAGAQEARAGHLDAAERTYNAALEMNRGADPDAFFELADLYFAQSRRTDLDDLAKRYEQPMFIAKGEAIRAGDYEKEYRFHLALGTMYAYLGQYGDASTPTSAIYQLQNAKRSAEDFNLGHPAARIPLDTKVVELLARSYAAVNDVQAAAALRLNAAEQYVREGKKASAKTAVLPLMEYATTLDAPTRERLEKIQRSIPQSKTQYIQPHIQQPAIDTHYDDVVEPAAVANSAAVSAYQGSVIAQPAYNNAYADAVNRVPLERQQRIVSLIRTRARSAYKAAVAAAEKELKSLGVVEITPADANSGTVVVMVDGMASRMHYDFGSPKKK